MRLTTLPPSCAVVTQSGNLNFLEPSGHLGPVMGLIYLFRSYEIKLHNCCIVSTILSFMLKRTILGPLVGLRICSLFGWDKRKERRRDLAYRQRNAYSSSEAKYGNKKEHSCSSEANTVICLEAFVAIKLNEICLSRQPCQSKS